MKPKANGNRKNFDAKDYIDMLPSLEGKLITYMGNEERILHHEFEEGNVVIKTDKRRRVFSIQQAAQFIQDSELVVIQESTPPAIVDASNSIEPTVFSSLTTVMLDNIQRVQQDPNYIKQAQAVNNSVKQVTHMVKTQLEYIRMMQKLKDQ